MENNTDENQFKASSITTSDIINSTSSNTAVKPTNYEFDSNFELNIDEKGVYFTFDI